MAKIDPSTLAIKNEPFIGGRVVRSKYDDIFNKVQHGQRIVCPSGTAARLAVQFRKWLAQRGYSDVDVKAKENCPDGQGGVWFLAGEVKPKTRWNTPNGRAPLKRAS